MNYFFALISFLFIIESSSAQLFKKEKVLYDANVFITPGGIFGTGGNGFIRISLCAPVERFELAIERVKNAGIAL